MDKSHHGCGGLLWNRKRIFFGASHHDSAVPSMATFPISPLNVVVHFCVYACSSDGGRSLSSCPGARALLLKSRAGNGGGDKAPIGSETEGSEPLVLGVFCGARWCSFFQGARRDVGPGADSNRAARPQRPCKGWVGAAAMFAGTTQDGFFDREEEAPP